MAFVFLILVFFIDQQGVSDKHCLLSFFSFVLLELSGKYLSFIAHCDFTHLELQGDHSVHVIKLQVMSGWSLEWDCSG